MRVCISTKALKYGHKFAHVLRVMFRKSIKHRIRSVRVCMYVFVRVGRQISYKNTPLFIAHSTSFAHNVTRTKFVPTVRVFHICDTIFVLASSL